MRKFSITSLLVGVGLLVIVADMRSQSVMTCGQGAIQRADGGILIDGYTIYANVTMPSPNNPPGFPQREALMPASKPGPTSVTLGKTIDGKTPICIESETGSKCIPLSTIRLMK